MFQGGPEIFVLGGPNISAKMKYIIQGSRYLNKYGLGELKMGGPVLL